MSRKMSRSKPAIWRRKKVAAAVVILALRAAIASAGPIAKFDIPAQPSSSALRVLASQAGVQLVFSPETVGAAQSAAVKGEMSIEAALEQLLAGSGLKVRQEGERNYVVVKDAQPARESMLSEMVVTATRTERRIEDVPASVSVITSRDLERQQFVKVEDALKNVEGIDFSQNASGGASVPMIRGIGGSFAGSTSAVIMDGLPTDSHISGVVGRGGLNFLAPQDIERIEVLRGPASALYGANVVGGVVNVIPKRWSGKPGAEVNAEFGSHNSKRLGAAVGMANDVLDVRLSVSDFRTDGYIAQPEADPWGDKDLAPRGWKDTKRNLIGAARPSDDQEISFGFQQFRTDTDYFGGRPNLKQNHHGDAYTLGYKKEFASQNSFKVNYRHTNLLQYMPWDDQEWNGNMGSFVLAATWFRRSIADTLEAQVDIRLSDSNTLIVGTSYQKAAFETGWDDVLFGGSSRSKSNATTSALFVQDEHRFGELAITAGGRYDHISQGASTSNGVTINSGANENTFNPRLGLRYRLSPATSLYTSAGTAFVPASADLKYPGDPVRFQNNPGLKPETSTTYEVGVNHKVDRASLRAALYHTDYKDMISAISVGAAFWPRRYVNIGKVEVNGLELGLEGQLPGGWHPYANYAYTDSIIKENPADPLSVGKRTQRVAPHKFNLGITYAPGDAWRANVAGRYVGERYFTDYNTPDHRASGYFVADAKVTTKIPSDVVMGRWEAYMAINNLFDKKYTIWEYEKADRRTVWLGLNGSF